MTIVIRKPYSRKGTPFHCTGESLTKQSFKDECDINHILKRYQKTGLLDHVSRHQGDYSDVTGAVDFHTAMNIVINAHNAFDSLPSSLRAKFNNDPAQFLDFVSNPDNAEDMIKLGLAKKIPQETPEGAQPAQDAPAQPPVGE